MASARAKLGRSVLLGLGTVLTPEAVRDAIRAGAAAVGVGDEIVSKDLLAQREFSEITRPARAFVEAVQLPSSKPIRRWAPPGKDSPWTR